MALTAKVNHFPYSAMVLGQLAILRGSSAEMMAKVLVGTFTARARSVLSSATQVYSRYEGLLYAQSRRKAWSEVPAGSEA